MNPDSALNNNPAAQPAGCFHCGEIIPSRTDIRAAINGEEQRVCCYGCKAVVETITGLGLEKYYRYRSDLPARPDSADNAAAPVFDIYDRADIQDTFITRIDSNTREVALIIEGIVCPACAWLIETRLSSLTGILNVAINYTARKAVIRWNNAVLPLSRILGQIHSLGYSASPFDPARLQKVRDRERKQYLLRIGVAGLLGMQVMMIAIALYAGDWTGIDENHKTFLQWVSLLLTLPVIVYAAWPFYRNSWRAIRNKRIDMDVPLATGISVAFLASATATLTGTGTVYYDSVVMLVFFLLTGRFLEFTVGNRAAAHIDNLAKIVPAMAVKTGADKDTVVPVSELKQGDVILVRPGDTIPVDGRIEDGRTNINESVITGEFMPVYKQTGDSVIAGSVNTESPVRISVTATGNNTCLSQICSLVESSLAEKPALTLLADRIAGWFLSAVLIIAGSTAIYWLHTDAGLWIPATVAVLIISCPCALSLATPTAFTVASNSLLTRGVAVIKTDALEKISSITHLAMDKTGTLTEGKLFIRKMRRFTSLGRDEISSLAGSLEYHSGHPVAHAFADTVNRPRDVSRIENFPGEGITGIIDNKRYFIGSPAFIRKHASIERDNVRSITDTGKESVWFANNNSLLATFELGDKPRTDPAKMIRDLSRRGIKTLIISGDNENTVAEMARKTGVDEYHARLTPEDKLSIIKKLQSQGARVAMVGDGVNDAPVLAAADISIALDSGTDLSKVHADILLPASGLDKLDDLFWLARKTKHIIRQNMLWAIGYNLIAVPVAVAGLVSPWMAAIGMSLSSLLVVSNSLRLGRRSAFRHS
ncbi:MAG TPA: heavy metal translocating P-type ATPase [Gammaproteobacteria bacterium]|nr:heavy metal translocating P-type ATPase [Gammaproteobacteria bacterium]